MIYRFLILLCFTINISTVKSEDSVWCVSYTITRDWVKMIEAVDYISPQQKERARYIWSSRSLYTSYSKLYFNDTVSMYSDDHSRQELSGQYSSRRREVYFIRRDFKNNEVYDILTFLRRTYIINDTLQHPKWRILNDIREISGHICMNATFYDSIKNQKIVAWFALDFPSAAGPERLTGLPGLILGVEVNDGAMEIIAESITKVPLGETLEMPGRFEGRRIRGENITENEYLDIVKQHMDKKREAEEYPYWGIRY